MMQSVKVSLRCVNAVQGLDALRFHVLPALRPYGVAGIEVCYSIVRQPQVVGVQFRDASGLRVERLAIPSTLTKSLESCVVRCVQSAPLDDGEGVVSIDLAEGRIVLQHYPATDAASVSRFDFQA
jgi:hypothetical protein